jgi:hypothetical protein
MKISSNPALFVPQNPVPRSRAPQALPSPPLEPDNAPVQQRPSVAQQPSTGLVTSVESQRVDITRGRLNAALPQNLGVRRALSEYQEVDAQPQGTEAAQLLGIDVYA